MKNFKFWDPKRPLKQKLQLVVLSILMWGCLQVTIDIVDDIKIFSHEFFHFGESFVVDFKHDTGLATTSIRHPGWTAGGAFGEMIMTAGYFIPNPAAIGAGVIGAIRTIMEPYPESRGDKASSEFKPLGPLFYFLVPFMPFVTIALYLLPKALRPRIIWRIWQLLKKLTAGAERLNASYEAKKIQPTRNRQANSLGARQLASRSIDAKTYAGR